MSRGEHLVVTRATPREVFLRGENFGTKLPHDGIAQQIHELIDKAVNESFKSEHLGRTLSISASSSHGLGHAAAIVLARAVVASLRAVRPERVGPACVPDFQTWRVAA